MRRDWGAWAASIAACALVVGLAVGFAIGLSVEARQRLFIGPPPEAMEETAAPGVPYKCTLGAWHVQPGDTVDKIIRLCMPGEHYGRAKDVLRPLNPHIENFGLIYPGQMIYLPERGR